MLAHAFDQMADALQERDSRLVEAAEELRQRLAELDRRTAQLEAAYKEMEGFSYSVSHDLKAPLRGIAGFARILLEEYHGRLDAEGKRYLEILQHEAARMGMLIDDLLALSRYARKEMDYAAIAMTTLSRSVWEELQAREPARHLEVEIHDLPPAYGDGAMIRQVLVNLLDNALKFTRDREVAKIVVSGWREGAENVYCVRDNGAGFDMAYASKLFGVFQRLHPDTRLEGTGVGLAIVERIVRRHGGRVWAEGKVGEGALFCFTLPVEN